MTDFTKHRAMLPEGATMQEALDWRRRRVGRALRQGAVEELIHEYTAGEVVDIDDFYARGDDANQPSEEA